MAKTTIYARGDVLFPITSIRLEEREVHDIVTIWERGAFVGDLTLSSGTGRFVVSRFLSEERLAEENEELQILVEEEEGDLG